MPCARSPARARSLAGCSGAARAARARARGAPAGARRTVVGLAGVGQRGGERAPAGRASRSTAAARGSRPAGPCASACVSIRGTSRAAPGVGDAGASNSAAAVALLDDLAGVHDRRPSATSATTPRSCVIMIMPCRARAQLREQVEDLRLDGHVERGRRLVGDEEPGVARRAPSRSSRAGASRRRAVRVVVDARVGVGIPTCSMRSTARRRPRSGAGAGGTLDIWFPTVSDGFSDVIGSWKIIAIRSPRSSRPPESPVTSRPSMTRPATMRARSGTRPDQRVRGHALSAAGLAHDASVSPGSTERSDGRPHQTTAAV